MGLIDWIRTRTGDNVHIRADIAKIRDLPGNTQIERMGAFMHHVCVECAARFVQDEQRRGKDSIFAGLDHRHFFHEMLLLNYWLANRMLGGKDGLLLGEMQKHYLVSFHHLSGKEKADDLSHMHERFAAFDDTWDDVTGHQDIFAEKFMSYLVPDVSGHVKNSVGFWIISHAFEARKKFRDIRMICKDLQVRTRIPGKKSLPESTHSEANP
ncbi:MAG: hypothetical protein OHK006_00840 [Thermodesulfovibrionales bacterium]